MTERSCKHQMKLRCLIFISKNFQKPSKFEKLSFLLFQLTILNQRQNTHVAVMSFEQSSYWNRLQSFSSDLIIDTQWYISKLMLYFDYKLTIIWNAAVLESKIFQYQFFFFTINCLEPGATDRKQIESQGWKPLRYISMAVNVTVNHWLKFTHQTFC